MRASGATRRQIERPPAHWLLLAFMVFALLAVLFAHGLTSQSGGGSSTGSGAAAGIGKSSPMGSPILSFEHGKLRPLGEIAPNEVVLTFDDGPHPEWTPQIASLLRRYDVPATFFVVGEQVRRHPETARDLREQGFELGNHGLTHADLGALPEWRRDMEVSLTESAIAGATGFRPRLLRPPYSATLAAVTSDQREYLSALAREGHLITLVDLDSEDWRRPGVDEIMSNATPRHGEGGVILFHDGGGDRSQTLAALEQLIPALQERGYEFVSLSDVTGIPEKDLEMKASESERLRGWLVIGALTASRVITLGLAALLIPVGLLALARALLMVAFAAQHARQSRRRKPRHDYKPRTSILVPAFNESTVIERTIRSLTASDYPDFEVIVIDDGSTDGTASIVESLALPRVKVIRQANMGKAAALNRGLGEARADIVVTVDADSVFERETLGRMVERFADDRVGAVAGNTKVGNRSRLIGRWQQIEYVMGFNLDRRLYDTWNCMPTVPGAIGAFRRAALEEVGGVSGSTLAEDTDVTIAIGRSGWRVTYADDARAYTETPSSLGGLWRQRYRWAYGTIQAFWKHRAAIWRREPGKVGRRGLPYLLLFQIVLPVLAPLIDLFAIYGVVFLATGPTIAAWLLFNLLLLVVGAIAFRLDREPLRDLWAMPLGQFVYRQLMYLVVVQSIFSAVRGIALRWQHVERTGDLEGSPAEARGG
jgi:poly-beta-1,6 N-acetyl-D-glucosamine synthase